MKKMLRILLGSLLLGCASLCGYGEINRMEVCGCVVDDESDQPLSDVVVTVISMPDSVVSGIDITDKKGVFCVRAAGVTDMIRFSKNGWTAVTLSAKADAVEVRMERAGCSLPEVMVKAKKVNMKGRPGMFVFNPGDLAKYVENAREILNYVPLLESPTKIFSKPLTATIYINGEPPSISQEVLLDKLKSMPPDKIKSVEIIMNPGAEHDKETLEGGIINIELVDDMIGWNMYANLSGNYGEGRLSSVEPAMVWFYQNHNFLLSANAGYRYADRFSSEYGELYDEVTGLYRKIKNERHGHDHSAMAGVTGEYRFGRSSASFSFHFSSAGSSGRTNNEETQYENMTEVVRNVTMTTEKSPWRPNVFCGARFLHWFDKERTMRLNVSAIIGRNAGESENMLYSESESPAGDREQVGKLDQSFDTENFATGMSVRFDKRFKDGSVFASRARINYDTSECRYCATDDAYDFSRKLLGQSLSASYQRQCAEWFSFRAGARGEYLIRTIRGEDGADMQKRFLLFYPNVSLSFNLRGGQHNINADWLTYPSYPLDFQLNPHKTWTSSTSYSCGNPDIPVKVCNAVSLQYGFLGNYFLSVAYRTGQTGNNEYIYLDESANKVTTYLMNEVYHNMDANANYSRDFFNYRWRIDANIGFTWRNSSATIGEGRIASHSLSMSFNLGSRVAISRRYGLDAAVRYSWTGTERQLTGSVGSLHRLLFSFSKDLWKNAYVEASVNIPLNEGRTMISNGVSLSDNITSKYGKYVSASATFTWRFGKMSIDRVSKIEL